MKLISLLVRYSRRTFILGILIGTVSGVSSAVLMMVINKSLTGDSSSFSALVAGFVALVLVALVSNFAARVLLIRLSQRVIFDLRMHLCRQTLAVPLRKLEEIGTHRVLAALTDDIPSITRALLEFPFLCINVTIVVGCLVYLATLSLYALLSVLVFFALGFLTVLLPKKKANRFLHLAREDADALLGHYRALTDGSKELKLHRPRREAFLLERLQATAGSLRENQVVAGSIYALSNSFGFVLYFILIGILLFLVPSISRIDRAVLTGCALTILYTRGPITFLLDLIPSFSAANISLGKVEALGLSLASFGSREDLSKSDRSKAKWHRLEFDGVVHTYYREGEDRNFTLGPIDLTVERGELIFLMGGNGSGKTTLAKLITGLYTPESGEIRVDGSPVTDANRDEYRQHFSAVFFDFYLFNLLGLDDPELERRAHDYLAKLQLNHKVALKGSHLSTTELSQGQRKRLALLIAYLEDRPIYLFDEWAADQDPTFKEVFYLHLVPELKAQGKTVIVISHDDRYSHIADRVIKLDYGRISSDEHAERLQIA